MDISSTTSQVSATTETTASSQSQKASSKGDTSFKDEMSKVSDDKSAKTNTKADAKKEDSTADTKQAESETVAVKTEKSDIDMIKASAEKELEHSSDLSQSILLSGEVFASNIQQDINPQAQAILDVNMMLSEVASATATKATPVKVDYSVVQMDMNDTQFFTELVQNQDKTLQNVVTELTQNPDADVQEIQKNIKVSATLMNALSEAVKNKQSFRIDFDKDISVIIKVDRDGAITARFIPGDSAVEQYLKQNMSTLRQRFDEQELAYKELSYTGQQKRERRNNNKENGHE